MCSNGLLDQSLVAVLLELQCIRQGPPSLPPSLSPPTYFSCPNPNICLSFAPTSRLSVHGWGSRRASRPCGASGCSC